MNEVANGTYLHVVVNDRKSLPGVLVGEGDRQGNKHNSQNQADRCNKSLLQILKGRSNICNWKF